MNSKTIIDTVLNYQSVIVAIQHRGELRWYYSDKDDWIMDLDQLAVDFKSPTGDCPDRYDICVLSEETIDQFEAFHAEFRVDVDMLREMIFEFFPLSSWEEHRLLFPMVLIDFDRKVLYSMEGEQPHYEEYVPSGWKGYLEIFYDRIPMAERY